MTLTILIKLPIVATQMCCRVEEKKNVFDFSSYYLKAIAKYNYASKTLHSHSHYI